MGAWDTLPRDWTNSVIAMVQAGVPTNELAGNTVFTDRLRRYVTGLGRLGQMRDRYVANQKQQTPDPAVAKAYHGVMEPLQREAKDLHRIAQDYLDVFSGWSIKFRTNAAADRAIVKAGVYRNHIEAVTDPANNEYLKVVKPVRPSGPTSPRRSRPAPASAVHRSMPTAIRSSTPTIPAATTERALLTAGQRASQAAGPPAPAQENRRIIVSGYTVV